MKNYLKKMVGRSTRQRLAGNGSTADGDGFLLLSDSIPNSSDVDDSSPTTPNQSTPKNRPRIDMSDIVSPAPTESTPQDLHKGDVPNEPNDSAVASAEEGVVSPSDGYDDNKDKDAFDEKTLSEDTFSFLIYSKVKSRSFFCAMLVFLMQITIYVIIAVNIIDLTDEKNPLGFPPDVDVPVRISEALAILIAIMTQDDVRKALILSREQFHQDGLLEGQNDLPHSFEGATATKWVLSIILRATEGLLGLSITFLMIMRSSTVTDLLLNFLAIEFVSVLDDVVFALAKEALLGRTLKEEAKNLSDRTYYVNHQFSKAAPYYTFAYFFILPLIMYVGWGIIWFYQESGKYSCQQILLQFGDEQLPVLGTFSGLFISQRKSFVGNVDRLSYAPNDNRDGGPLLAYCEEEKRWTLSLSKGDAPNPCDWYAASEESEDFDFVATSNSPWFVKTAQNRAIPLGQHFIACHDCTDNLCGPYGKCSNKGTCECDPGYYGLRCEYPEACQRLEIDPRDDGFLKEGGDYFASKYYRLEGAEAYNHPVYTSLGENQTLNDETDIILFTGVRWMLSFKRLFPGLKDVNDVSGLAKYFSQFHGHFTEYATSFVSEPVHIDSPLDATASPLSVRWQYSTSESRDQRLQPDLQKDLIGSSFFCAVCNGISNPCSYGAVCLSNGTCGDCPNNSSGTMCQIPPTSNGQCNPYFNNINFGFDGGDCCESTCRSTPENTCGKAGGGYIDTGYPSCRSVANQWQLSGDPVYGVSSASRSGLALALSGKGTILAVADPGVSIVRLFEKAGAEWIERGQVQGPPDSDFGLAISLSDESFNIARNSYSSPTVTLAVGAPNAKFESLGLVRVFKCSTNGCFQRGKDIDGGGSFGNSVSISKDGNSIAIGGADREITWPYTHGEVKVFTWSKDTKDWQRKQKASLNPSVSGQPSSETCAHLYGGEWVRVRHVPAGNIWHPATDSLAGTDVYGIEGVDSAPWSVNFASKLPAECPYSEFLFATGDCTKWLVATTDAVIGANYADRNRPILASSDKGYNYAATWYNRVSYGEDEFFVDPWVSINDHFDAIAADKMMYGEGSSGSYTTSFQLNGGADVYVRSGDPDPDRPIFKSCAHLYGGKWVRVRHVPAGNSWHPATDSLAGTEVYGIEDVDSAPWSVNFASKLPAECPSSEFLFATGDCTKWLVATTDAVIGEHYAEQKRPILASSDKGFNYAATWYNREEIMAEPWVSINVNHDASVAGKMVYGEASSGDHTTSLQLNGGADVYVRSRDPDCSQSCAHLYGGKWVRVRHVPAGNSWHPATDSLAGTEVYGVEGVDSAPWSVNFASKLPAECPSSEFLFATGDCTKWLVATTDAVIGANYGAYWDGEKRPILASSDKGYNYAAKWYNRVSNGEDEFAVDPWVSINDHFDGIAAGKMMYGEGSSGSYTTSIQLNGGADVYVRSGDPDCPSSQPSSSSEASLVPSKSADGPSLNLSFSTNPTSERDVIPIDRYSLQGYYVSLSGDYLAVGNLEGAITSGPRYESVNLIVQVYKLVEGGWMALGNRIEKAFYIDESFRALWPLKSVVIKGSIVAIGSKSSVDVYSWNEASSEWTPRKIDLEASGVNGLIGWSVDLSQDASILAVGASVENPQPTDESIHVYKWDGQRYNALFNGIPAGPASSVALSSDGQALAVGLPFDALTGGSTRVYSFRPSSPCNNPSEIPLRISFTTDASPEETSWELRVGSEVKLKRSSNSLSVHTTYVEETCVSATSCVKFIVYDVRGDGLSPPGVFSIMLNGTEVARGDGNFEFYDVKSFGDCSCSEDEVNFTLVARSNFYTKLSILQQNKLSHHTGWNLITDNWNENSFSTLVVDECIPKDCYYLSLIPFDGHYYDASSLCIARPSGKIDYNATYDGGSIISTGFSRGEFCPNSHKFGQCLTASTLKCDEGSNLVQIDITLGENPWEMFWFVQEMDKYPYILAGGYYEVKGATIHEEICKPVDDCYHFIINSTDDANALISLDGNEVFIANKTKSETRIGDCKSG